MRENLSPCGRVMFGMITSKTFAVGIMGGVVVIKSILFNFIS